MNEPNSEENISFEPMKSQIIRHHIDVLDKPQLKRIYMPFIKGGGIFISTDQPYDLNDEIIFTIKLLEESEINTLKSKVVWINPKYTQGGLPQGVGVQFIENENNMMQTKIENYLTGFSGKEQSDTM